MGDARENGEEGRVGRERESGTRLGCYKNFTADDCSKYILPALC